MKTQKLTKRTKCDFQCHFRSAIGQVGFQICPRSVRAIVTVVAPSLLSLPIANAYKPTYSLGFTVENIFFCQCSFERHGLSASSVSFKWLGELAETFQYKMKDSMQNESIITGRNEKKKEKVNVDSIWKLRTDKRYIKKKSEMQKSYT